MPRYSLTLTEQERDDLKELAEDDGRTMASMMRVVFKRGLHVSISASEKGFTTSIPRQNSVSSASVQQSPTPARERESSSGEEKKEDPEKRRSVPRLAPKDLTQRILSYLNEQAGTNFKMADGHRKHIQSALSRGATEDDMREVIRKKSLEWKNVDKMKHCLRPSTLFGAKFDEYVGQLESTPTPGQGTLPELDEDHWMAHADNGPGSIYDQGDR